MKTHFGYKQVDAADKQSLVGEVFSSVAGKYDVMNDAMSAGLHRVWKQHFVAGVPLADGYRYLDLAGGSGDITSRIMAKAAKYGKAVDITLSDINPDMLAEGQARAINNNWQGKHGGTLNFAQIDAQEIPFEDASLDVVTIAFGIRNVPDIPLALREIYRVLKPGGSFMCLEFSHIDNPLLAKIYDVYSFNVIPKMGQLLAGDAESYRYLVESIRMFPKAADFATMIEEAGFASASYEKLQKGVVAIHRGDKPC